MMTRHEGAGVGGGDKFIRSGVTIEPITIERFEGYHRALDRVANEAKYLGSTSAPSLNKSLTFVENNIRLGNPHLVVIDDDEVIGWCDICREDDENRGELGMGLLPDYREKGIGSAVLAEALKAAKRAGIAEVVLTVHTDNSRAIALYEKAGFVELAGSTRMISLDGVPRKAMTMLLAFEA